ncbi:MAG: PVC-type heme-binding CxxCH protein [Verrucomicrobiales bacterium]
MKSYLLLLHLFLAMGAVCRGEKVIFSPHTFTIPEGYDLARVAAPPLVQRPIHMSFDEDGVLYVTDSSGNTDNAPDQLKNPTHRVLRLVDRDGDGTFDDSTVFAEKLPFPEGILVHEGSVYVGAPPHIWKLRDTDGDHVADERTSWFNGGSIEGCGNDLHGPYMGIDGYFYWCKGAFDPQTHVLGNGKTFKSSAAHIYRSKPDGAGLEVVMTGGMNNPVGLAFSETGDRFLSGTFFDLSGPGKRDGILHAVYGGMYGRKNDRVLSPHPNTGGLLPILTQMGPAAPSGIVMPRSNALGLRGDLFCSNFNLRRISRHRLTPNGSSYTSTNESFLESDQSDFHPTDVIEDADGSLLVADTGSWYMICCPTSKVAKPHVLGSIYRIQKKGPPEIEDPRGLRMDWEKPEVKWLSDGRPFVVSRSIEALAVGDNIDQLKKAEARIPALWTLHRISGQVARESVREFLNDKSSKVIAAAIHSIGLWRDAEAVLPLISILRQDDPYLARLAAMALGKIGNADAVKPLIEASSKSVDEFLKHAITYALYEIGDPDSLPAKNQIADQVRRMISVEEGEPSLQIMPNIEMGEVSEPDPQKKALQTKRLRELVATLPEGDAKRGRALFHNVAKSLCLTCHVMGEQGVKYGPDLTGIGSIRSEQDLLEAIIYPSSSISRYYERVLVETKEGESGGLILRDTRDQIILSNAPGVEVNVAYKRNKIGKVFKCLFDA